mmetsp:Transcript_20575/g.57366  ORF Transcript_20575/g.57366 Transcript_20575/m.57366 type:complete len:81 (-) Transcript_20575:1384-1626(-)
MPGGGGKEAATYHNSNRRFDYSLADCIGWSGTQLVAQRYEAMQILWWCGMCSICSYSLQVRRGLQSIRMLCGSLRLYKVT